VDPARARPGGAHAGADVRRAHGRTAGLAAAHQTHAGHHHGRAAPLKGLPPWRRRPHSDFGPTSSALTSLDGESIMRRSNRHGRDEGGTRAPWTVTIPPTAARASTPRSS
jgi:hypothetical protein